MPVLAGLLTDPQPHVRWWGAIHLSRTASVRLQWDFWCTGAGEAAEALYHLGPLATPALPHLCESIRQCGRHTPYDAELAARAVWKIVGQPDEALGLLQPVKAGESIDRVLQEIQQVAAGGRAPKEAVWPPRHASFVARFVQRPGDYQYWWDRPVPDPRGAY